MSEGRVIRPQDFIRDPYIDCPNCGAKDAFGIIFVSDHSYTRRCKVCLQSVSDDLPRLAKKLIYLDQFAVSDMMKATNPASRAHREGRVDPFWRQLHETLARLCWRQLIACPDSEYHQHESAVSPFRSELENLLRRFSAGVSFRDHITVERFQIQEQVTRWIARDDATKVEVKQRSVITGDLSAWADVFFVSVDVGDPDGYLDELRRSREEGLSFLEDIFNRWRAEERGFLDHFRDESQQWALALPAEYSKHLERLARASRGEEPATPDLVFPPSAVDRMRAILHALRAAGVAPEDVWPKVFEYLASGLVEWLPFVRIRAALWATLAAQAKDRARTPGRGMLNDIEMISALLPYCDAIFVDRECHGLLRNIPQTHRPNYACRVFSVTNKEECLAYLAELEAEASEEHMSKLREVYGDRVS